MDLPLLDPRRPIFQKVREAQATLKIENPTVLNNSNTDASTKRQASMNTYHPAMHAQQYTRDRHSILKTNHHSKGPTST